MRLLTEVGTVLFLIMNSKNKKLWYGEFNWYGEVHKFWKHANTKGNARVLMLIDLMNKLKRTKSAIWAYFNDNANNWTIKELEKE